jgi:hypothetical protein
MRNGLIWALAAATAASYGVLIFWLAPQLSAQSQGMLPFDLRVTGYGLEAARDYLAALSPEGRALYLGPIRVNDTLFPSLMTLLLLVPMRRWRGWGLLWALPALAYLALDLAENAAVAGILRAETAGEAEVALASALTQGKFAAFGLALVVAVGAVWVNRRAD